MVILVKNEDDIIESNIRFHARMGVDSFIVMDNNSNDNTPDILHSLKKEYDLTVIHQPSADYQQRQWMGQMIQLAKKKGASWVIPNDADEFWVPRKGNDLKATLVPKDSTLTLHRSNVLLSQENFSHSQNRYKIIKTTAFTQEQELLDDRINILFAQISPKVIVNPHGLISISGGNHRAKHIANYFTARHSSDIEVLHFPIRTWERFRTNIKNRANILASTPNVRMGDHYRRWTRMLNEGTLRKEFNQFFASKHNLERFRDQVEKIDFSL